MGYQEVEVPGGEVLGREVPGEGCAESKVRKPPASNQSVTNSPREHGSKSWITIAFRYYHQIKN